MLKYRLIFGPVMIAGLLGLFWLDALLETRLSDWPAGLALAAAAAVLLPLGAIEFAELIQAKGVAVNKAIAALGTVAAAWAVYCPQPSPVVAIVMAVVCVAALAFHIRKAELVGAMAAAGGTLLIVTALGVMGGFFLAMRHDHSAYVVLAVMLITKSGDIGAYFTGRALGRHKLIPFLSPKKTWEGLAGAVGFAILVALGAAWLARHYDIGDYPLGLAALCGVTFALVGHAGDLMMSLFKRDAGVKDSGATIPGFGGVLDVIDSPLLVAPVAYWVLHVAT